MALGKEDIELVDALQSVGALSRSTAHDVAINAQPGRVASYITERGFVVPWGSFHVIVERLAKYEADAEADRQDRAERDYLETD